MEIYEYQALAMRTSNAKLTKTEHVINGALGLCGEAGEVKTAMTRDEYLKEAGDVCWYMAELATAIGIDLAPIMDVDAAHITWVSPRTSADRIILSAASIADSVKKSTMQGHDYSIDYIKKHLKRIAIAVHWIAKWYDTNIAEVMTMNIDKLKMRYPDGGFSTERSINREEGAVCGG